MTDQNSTTHGYNDLDLISNPIPAAKSATKVIGKRGRKGVQTSNAFKALTAVPVDLIKYAETYDISFKTLRQIKRHDPFKELGQAFVRKCTNKNSEAYGTMQIWREPAQKSK